jgi:hypothetical protein
MLHEEMDDNSRVMAGANLEARSADMTIIVSAKDMNSARRAYVHGKKTLAGRSKADLVALLLENDVYPSTFDMKKAEMVTILEVWDISSLIIFADIIYRQRGLNLNWSRFLGAKSILNPRKHCVMQILKISASHLT